jgi:Protein of unknown function (DUF3617)
MRSIVLGSLIALAVGVHGLAHAQSPPPIKPGLWQVRGVRDVDGQRMPDMSEHLKNMPPETRRQMEAMMKQHGVDASGGARDMKVCLSRESIDPNQWQGQMGTCKTEYLTRTATNWKWHTSCLEPASETDGEATFNSAERYTVKVVTTAAVMGQSRTSRMTLDSKWLGPDCGDLKPVTPPRP